MTEHHGPRFVRRLSFNPARQHIADASQLDMTEGIVTVVVRDYLAIFGARSFSDHDYGVTRFAVNQPGIAHALVQKFKNSLVAKRIFGNQNHVRLTSDARPECEVSR